MTIQQALNDLQRTLEGIEVRGKDNLDRLLGSILLVEKLSAALNGGETAYGNSDHQNIE